LNNTILRQADVFCGNRFVAKAGEVCTCYAVGVECTTEPSSEGTAIYDVDWLEPTLVQEGAFCNVGKPNENRKQLLYPPFTVAECSAAVELDSFCGTRFDVTENVGCFCISVDRPCNIVASSNSTIYDANNRAVVVLPPPSLVQKNAYCAVSDPATERKTLGDRLSILECSNAVAADPFCGRRFFGSEGGACFCIKDRVSWEVLPSTDGPQLQLVLQVCEASEINPPHPSPSIAFSECGWPVRSLRPGCQLLHPAG
jgi:hypothetical protein